MTDHVYLAIFVENLVYSDYFCQIFNSDNWFHRKRLKFLILVHKVNWPCPMVAKF